MGCTTTEAELASEFVYPLELCKKAAQCRALETPALEGLLDWKKEYRNLKSKEQH